MIQPPAHAPAMEPVIGSDPEPTVSPAEESATEPAVEPSLPRIVLPSMTEQTPVPRRLTRKRAEPSWLKGYVT